MDHGRQAVEYRPDDQLTIDRMRQRTTDPDITERLDRTLVERDVLVRVARHAVDRQPGDVPHLAILVPRHQRRHVDLAAPQLVDARGRVGDEAEQDPANGRQRVARQ